MKLIKIVVFALFSLCITTSFASEQHEAEGVVKEIKSSDKKITIAHGPIKTLGMDGMTMDFKVYDPSMLSEVKQGHMISMVIEQDKQGNFIIMEIEDRGMANNPMASGGHNH